jgi:hypothetical protein
VAHHQRRVEVEQDDEAAEHDLADHPEDEPGGQPDEVPPVGAPAEGGEDGHDHHDRHRPGHGAVHELDEGVVLERGDDPTLGAGRPVRAPQPGAGHPHRPARHDDETEGDEGRHRDLAVGGRSDGESVAHRLKVRGSRAPERNPGQTTPFPSVLHNSLTAIL